MRGLRHSARWMGWTLLVAFWAAPPSQAQLHSATAVEQLRPGKPTQTFISPLDPGLSYSEYVGASIDANAARFDRLIINWDGNLNSPGTRINFASDATKISVQLDYQSTISTPGAGLFGLEMDGELQALTIGSDTDVGSSYYIVHKAATYQGRREYSLIFPYGSQVAFQGLRLSGGAPGLLGTTAPRPSTLYAAYGDSITHGFQASSTSAGYPYQVGKLQQERVINMGFIGRKITGSDGTGVAFLGADRITIAIGVNDFIGGDILIPTSLADFSFRYDSFIDNVRAVQPTVPIFAITPTWYSQQSVPNSLGLDLDDYRQAIRDVVFQSTVSDPNLYLIEGTVLVPPGPQYFPNVHPNDAGFGFYALHLGGANLVADSGFELDGYAWTDNGNSEVVTSAPFSGLKALQIGPGAGGREQPAGRVLRGTGYLLSAWSKVGSGGEIGRLGISFFDANDVEVAKQELQVTWTSYQQAALSVSTPAQFAYAKVFCSKDPGASFLLVDDFSLIEVGSASQAAYGQGLAGTLGVPSLRADDALLPGATISLELGNSRGRPTLGGLLFSRLDRPLSALADVFSCPSTLGALAIIPAEGLSMPLTLPNSLQCGDRIMIQSLQRDPGAPGGFSASRLLSLTMGRTPALP